jgi:O-antigen ligase
MVLAVTVALHAVSRNALLLLVLLAPVALCCRYRSWRAFGAGALAVTAVAGAMWQFAPTTKARFLELAANLQAAASGTHYGTSGGLRWRMFQEAFQGMLEHPWLGTGVGTWLPHWRTTWMAMDVDLDAETKRLFSEINNPHNDFLLAGMETGIAGLLLLAWVLWRFARLGWRQQSAPGNITVLMAVSLFVTCLVNAPLRDAALGMTLLWLLGVSVAAQRGAPHA